MIRSFESPPPLVLELYLDGLVLIPRFGLEVLAGLYLYGFSGYGHLLPFLTSLFRKCLLLKISRFEFFSTFEIFGEIFIICKKICCNFFLEDLVKQLY